MYVSIPLLAFVCSLAVLMWGTGAWIAIRINRKERAREDQDRLVRQVATEVLGPADADGRREGGLADRFEDHCRRDEAAHNLIDTYTKVFTAKIAKLYRKNGWGSDEYVVAQVQAELRGEYIADPIDTGAHPVIDPHHLPQLPPPAHAPALRRQTPHFPPIRREDDDDDRKKR